MRDNKILTIIITAAVILLFGVLIVVKNLPEDSTNTADNSVASAEAVTDMPTDQPTEVPAEEAVTPTESQTDEDETASTESATEESSPEATESVDTAEKATEEPAAAATEAPTEAATESPTEVPTEVPADIPTEVATEAPTEALAQAPVAAVYTFRNQKLLDQHYEKHGIEMGFPSAAAYEAAASAVITNPAALHKQEKEDGDFVYYVEATNEFVVLSTDGYIRTYFLPDRGKAYYDKQ